MSGASDKYIVNGMSTVIICPIDGINLSIKEEMDKIEQKIEKKVKEILTDLKASHSKFIDPDFGPNDEDEYGAKSLYGNSGKPDPAGSKYPAPETLSWERPQYADGGLGGNGNGENEDEEDEDEDDDDDLGYFRKDESKVELPYDLRKSFYLLLHRCSVSKGSSSLMEAPLEMLFK